MRDAQHESELEFRRIHRRFARSVLGIYLTVSIVALGALTAALLSDLQNQDDVARDALALETDLRAEYLGRYMATLGEEVQRIGARPEIDLLDQELAPEQELLGTRHGTSVIFNRGFALLDPRGEVLWSSPPALFAGGPPLGPADLASLTGATGVQMLANRQHATELLVASPVRRSGQFTGVLLAVIDVAEAQAIDTVFGRRMGVTTALISPEGQVVFQSNAADPTIGQVGAAHMRSRTAFLTTTSGATPLVVAGAPVPRTGFTLLSAAQERALLGPTRRRVAARLATGLALSLIPLLGISLVLQASLRRFRAAEEEAIKAERMRSLGQAAALIAHEVRNSLNSLGVGLDVVLAREAPEQGSRRAQILTSLRGEMHRLAEFTTELLTFSRGVRPQPVPLELSGFVAKVLETLRASAEERGVTLDVRGTNTPRHVSADATLVHVVLTNVVGNAIDFAGHGGPPRVDVEVTDQSGRPTVRVSDNGPGVAPSVATRLFEPFVTGRSNGVGIGLALSRSIMRAHGGDLRYLPAERGACFEFSFPEAG